MNVLYIQRVTEIKRLTLLGPGLKTNQKLLASVWPIMYHSLYTLFSKQPLEV